MKIDNHIIVHASKDAVWNALTDFENMEKNIRSVIKIEILELPTGMSSPKELKGAKDITGVKWSETRPTCGNGGEERTETMWVSNCVHHEYYEARSESAECSFVCKLYMVEQKDSTGKDCYAIGMAMEGTPQTFLWKVMMFLMGWYFVKVTKKAIMEDLEDIKKLAESSP